MMMPTRTSMSAKRPMMPSVSRSCSTDTSLWIREISRPTPRRSKVFRPISCMC